MKKKGWWVPLCISGLLVTAAYAGTCNGDRAALERSMKTVAAKSGLFGIGTAGEIASMLAFETLESEENLPQMDELCGRLSKSLKSVYRILDYLYQLPGDDPLRWGITPSLQISPRFTEEIHRFTLDEDGATRVPKLIESLSIRIEADRSNPLYASRYVPLDPSTYARLISGVELIAERPDGTGRQRLGRFANVGIDRRENVLNIPIDTETGHYKGTNLFFRITFVDGSRLTVPLLYPFVKALDRAGKRWGLLLRIDYEGVFDIGAIDRLKLSTWKQKRER